jgi:hypothetical protein
MTAIAPAGVEPEFGTGAFCLLPTFRLLILVPESRDVNPLLPPPTPYPYVVGRRWYVGGQPTTYDIPSTSFVFSNIPALDL